MPPGLVGAAQNHITGFEIHHAHGHTAGGGKADGLGVLEKDRALADAFGRADFGFYQQHGTDLDFDTSDGRHGRDAVRIHDEDFLPRVKFAEVAGAVVGKAGIGMNGARVDAERTGGHILVVFRFGMHQKGEGAGIAGQHPLTAPEQGEADSFTCEEEPTQEEPAENAEEAPEAPAEPEKKKPSVWVWVVGALAVIAVVAAILIAGKKDTAQNPADAQDPAATETEITAGEDAAQSDTVSYTATEEQLTDDVLALPVATCGGKVMTNKELDFFYWQQYYTFASNYSAYLSYILDQTKGLEIACGGGDVLVITELQAEGGKRMAASAYFNGHPIKL